MKALRELGLKKVVKFAIFQIVNVLFTTLIFSPLKVMFIKLLGARVGKDTAIMNVKIFNWHHRGPKDLKIGSQCFIGDETMLDLYGAIHIEDMVTIAQRVIILTHTNVGYKNHPLQKHFPKKVGSVKIKSGSVVGAGSIILPSIEIGEQSFVAAGSVVTKNVTARTLVAGVPAKFIRKIK